MISGDTEIDHDQVTFKLFTIICHLLTLTQNRSNKNLDYVPALTKNVAINTWTKMEQVFTDQRSVLPHL